MTIVAIHELSAAGTAALNAATDQARSTGRDVTVLATYSGVDAPGARAAESDAVRSAVTDATRGLDVRCTVLMIDPGEDPTASTIDAVHNLRPDLVVIGTRHRSAVGKFLLGRAQQRLLLEIEHPILLVKA